MLKGKGVGTVVGQCGIVIAAVAGSSYMVAVVGTRLRLNAADMHGLVRIINAVGVGIEVSTVEDKRSLCLVSRQTLSMTEVACLQLYAVVLGPIECYVAATLARKLPLNDERSKGGVASSSWVSLTALLAVIALPRAGVSTVAPWKTTVRLPGMTRLSMSAMGRVSTVLSPSLMTRATQSLWAAPVASLRECEIVQPVSWRPLSCRYAYICAGCVPTHCSGRT